MRQSSAEIDHAILDVAAGIFATHGFEHASVQQIADAVGYSKPGLLHRFGSKEALHRGVLTEVLETVQELTGYAVEHSTEPDQLRQVMERVARKALERPGMVQMMLKAFEPDCVEPGVEAIQGAGYRLLDSLDHPLSTPAERLRVALALQLVVNAAATQHSSVDTDMHVDTEVLVPMVVELSTFVMAGPLLSQE